MRISKNTLKRMNMKAQQKMISEVLDVQTKQIQGQSVPALGFGTYGLQGEACQSAVSTRYFHLSL